MSSKWEIVLVTLFYNYFKYFLLFLYKNINSVKHSAEINITSSI